MLPVLFSRALADAGYDLIEPSDDGWFLARVSGSVFHERLRLVGGSNDSRAVLS
jgi:hypothetical protein